MEFAWSREAARMPVAGQSMEAGDSSMRVHIQLKGP